MGLQWTADIIRFMLDAAEHSDYYQKIAERVAAYLPPEAHVCDAGCGLGGLSLAMLPYCRHVTAVDVNPAPIAALRARLTKDQRRRLDPVCGDILKGEAERRYDAMVFCLFGSMDEILEIVSSQCAGPAIVVKRDYAGHRIRIGESRAARCTADKAEALLRRMDIPCRTERFTLEMGQPFRSLNDAECFFRAYSEEREPSPDEIRQRLTAGPSPEFPYYLPVQKPLSLLAFQADDVRKNGGAKMPEKRHILICGEPGVGKTTLIRRLLSRSQRPLYGFATKRDSEPDADGAYPVYIHPAAQREADRTRGPENLVGTAAQGRGSFYPQVFDQLGVQLLQAPENALILMDELGFMENAADRFRSAVLRALEGDVPVLAAVKTRDTAFLREVRSHPNGRLYVITPENRDSLYRQLLPQILQWNRSLKL